MKFCLKQQQITSLLSSCEQAEQQNFLHFSMHFSFLHFSITLRQVQHQKFIHFFVWLSSIHFVLQLLHFSIQVQQQPMQQSLHPLQHLALQQALQHSITPITAPTPSITTKTPRASPPSNHWNCNAVSNIRSLLGVAILKIELFGQLTLLPVTRQDHCV